MSHCAIITGPKYDDNCYNFCNAIYYKHSDPFIMTVY